MAQKRSSVSVDVPNLMLSWQEAALLAIGLGAAAVLLAVAGHATRRAVAHPHRSPPLPALRQRHYEPQDDQHAGQHRGDHARGDRAGDEIRDEQHRHQHCAAHRG